MSFRCCALAICALSATLSLGQDVPVEKYRLPNGMTIILHVDHKVPQVAVNTWFKVGSKDEPPHHSGFAHLFEHLMFMGTNRVPTGDFDRIMEGGGGNNNASTAEDRTNYFDIGPSNLLPTLLWLEADRIEELGKAMTLKKLNLQRDVVKNERRQNTENTPYGSSFEIVNGLLFPPGHPYHTSVIGSMSDLDNASVKDVQQFFSTYYVPNNASMVVAGDFDPAPTKQLIARLFGTLLKAPPVPRKPVPSLGKLGVKTVTLADKVQFPRVMMVWHSPADFQPGDAEMSLAASVLADGLTSRLYQRLVVKDKLASAVEAFQESRILGSAFYVSATASANTSVPVLQRALDDELSKFKASGPTPEELKRQVAKTESGVLSGLQSTPNVADALNSYEFHLGKPNSFKFDLDRYRSATPAQVRAMAARTLDFQNRAIIITVPGKKPEAAPTKGAAERFAPVQNPRDQKPAIGKPRPFQIPAPQVLTLANGTQLNYWQRSELPLMSVSLLIRAGADEDTADKNGLASLTSDLITEGAGKRDAAAYHNALDLLGASVDGSVTHRSTEVTLNVLSRNFRPALSLFADAVHRPRFDPAEVERVKRVQVAELTQERDQVGSVSSKVAMREFFGADQPMGRPVSGTPESIGALTRNDVVQEHDVQYRASNATFYAAGSLPASEVKAELDREFKDWENKGEVRPATPAIVENGITNGPKVVIVDKPGAVQTAIRFVMPAPAYGSPERLKLKEVLALLGGGFTSRLNQNLREDKGYTYGAGASLIQTPEVGYVAAAASVRADVTGASVAEFLKEFRKISKGDITPTETEKATATIRGETIDRFSTLDGLIAEAISMSLVNRPLEGVAEDQRALENLTAALLNETAKTAVPFDQGVLVLVGDKTQILKQLAGLHLPEPVEVKF